MTTYKFTVSFPDEAAISGERYEEDEEVVARITEHMRLKRHIKETLGMVYGEEFVTVEAVEWRTRRPK